MELSVADGYLTGLQIDQDTQALGTVQVPMDIDPNLDVLLS